MKIIRKGVKPSERIMHGTCRCGCIVECTEGETQSLNDPREPGQYVKCPTCGCHMDVQFGRHQEYDIK